MQHTLATCQLRTPRTSHVVPESTPRIEQSCGRKKGWRPNHTETVAGTCSRHTGPRAWRRALERAVERGLIPGFTGSTWAIVDVLRSRMGYDSGHARYVLADVIKQTGLGRAAVTKHVALLRAAGWLVWVEHGSQRNALRGVGGYARTATVYAATIPPAYDEAEGNVLTGRGYSARVLRPAVVVDTAGNEAVDNSLRGPGVDPFPDVVKEEGQVQVVGGRGTSTGQARTAHKIPRRKKKATVTGYKITGERIERARKIAAWVRPLVNWVQRATLDQLSWVLLDLVARDWTDNQILLWLGHLGHEVGAPKWRPRFPHRVIAAALKRKDEADTQQAHGYTTPEPDVARAATAPNEEYAAAREIVRRNAERDPAGVAPRDPDEGWQSWLAGGEDDPGLTDAERRRQLAAGLAEPELVLSCARILGRDATVDLYGQAAARLLDQHAEFQTVGFGRVALTA